LYYGYMGVFEGKKGIIGLDAFSIPRFLGAKITI
jgi:hypothetical protein